MHLKTFAVSTIISNLELVLGLYKQYSVRYAIWVIPYCTESLELPHRGDVQYTVIALNANDLASMVVVVE